MPIGDTISARTAPNLLVIPRRGRPLALSEHVAVWGLVLVLFGGVAALGGEANATGLLLSAAAGLALSVLLLTNWGRSAAAHLATLSIPAALFFALLLYGLFSLRDARSAAEPLQALANRPSNSIAIDRSRALIELIKFLGLGCLFVSGFLLGRSGSRKKAFLQAFVIAGGVYAAAALASFLNAPTSLMIFWNKALFTNRLTGSFLSANTAGTFFGVLALIALSIAVQPRQWPSYVGGRFQGAVRPTIVVTIATFTLSVVCLLGTASRTATLAFVGASVFFLISEGILQKWSWKVAIGIVIPVAVLGFSIALCVNGGQVISRMAVIAEQSVSRKQIYFDHWQLVKISSLFGYGFGSFEQLNRHLITPATFESLWNVRALHNVFLQWLEQAGFLGLSLAATLLFLLVRTRKADSRKTGGVIKKHRTLLFAITIMIQIHGLTDFALEIPSISSIWAVFLGLELSSGPTGRCVSVTWIRAQKNKISQSIRPLIKSHHSLE